MALIKLFKMWIRDKRRSFFCPKCGCPVAGSAAASNNNKQKKMIIIITAIVILAAALIGFIVYRSANKNG